MKDDEFEWDDVKAAQNLANHGVIIGPIDGTTGTTALP
jgi:uncharacterized DUF497 family protein